MKWYEGGIAEAVLLSRQRGSIFVVYIEGADDKSKQITEVLNTADVSQVLENERFVAVKVEANGVAHAQFSEIYQNPQVPSIYFIGKTGTPLEIITSVTHAHEAIEKINSIVIKSGGTTIKVNTENLLQAEASDGVVCDGDVCVKVSPPSPGTSVENKEQEEEKKPSVEERLKLAQELIEKKRAVQKSEEEENEKQKEVERRKVGQDVLKMKRWQQDQEIKQQLEERQKEKREEQEARDKVRRQIEEDKREKAARSAASSQHSAGSTPAPAAQQPAAAARAATRSVDSNVARLQFRLPDGSSHTHDFASSTSLQEVNSYIRQNVPLTFSNFVLSTTFPRREFGRDDMASTLLDLELVPNAVVLVLPVAHGTVNTNQDLGFTAMIWYILTPLFSVFGYIKGLVFGASNDSTTTNEKRSHADASEPTESSSRPSGPKRRAGESAIRRQGNSNVHRLTDRDSDDENNTWNGNSTQQM